MLDLTRVGAHLGNGAEDQLTLGVYLPNITADKGYRLFADMIHQDDQFDPTVPAVPVELSHRGDPYDLWTFEGRLTEIPSRGRLGTPGRHLYRYRLMRHGQLVVTACVDPFARASGPGTLSAFDFPALPPYVWGDDGFRVPPLRDLIVYELMVDDFAHDFDGTLDRLTYLQSLGVNCIELMPVTNVPEPYRWGYMPISYFAVEERYGGRERLQALVEASHQLGIAVIHDAVYAHSHAEFCYRKLYWEAGEDNPMIGPFAEDMFGVGPDFDKPFARDYFRAVNAYFIDELHVDGFRYDYVPGFYDGPAGNGYARLVYETYQASKGVARFADGESSRIIQAAEYLAQPKTVLRETYTSASKRWGPMLLAQQMVQAADRRVPEALVHEMLLIDFSDPWPNEYRNPATDEHFPVAPLQFIESHDKSRLMYLLSGEHSPWDGGFDLFNRDLSTWYRLQPFAILLLTAEGVPLLWQGQEFGEIYGLHDDGGSRVLAARPLHWNYFYEPGGRALVRLYRTLGTLRQRHQALRSRSSYYHYDRSDLGHGLVAYQRHPDNPTDPIVMVLLNFGDYDGEITVPFPKAGAWTEQLNGDPAEVLHIAVGNSDATVWVPANYGKVFVSG